MLYFAYGSNMCTGRLRQRVPSANPVRVAKLLNHAFRFHKRSGDLSGKCDAYFTGETTDVIWGACLTGSPSYIKQALRTLRRLLGKAVEWKTIMTAPPLKLVKEMGREQTIDPDCEAKLLAAGRQPMRDVLIIIQDTGMRPEEVFRIRVENIDWSRRLIFNPHGKTRASTTVTHSSAYSA
jgi:integrase